MAAESPKKQSQFKPNLPEGKIDAKCVVTKDYENKRLYRCGENKANQTQYKPKTNPISWMLK